MLNPSTARTEMTLREREEFEQTKELADKQTAYNLEVKRLELEVAKIESRWGVLLRVPITIIKLPVLIIMAVGYCIATAKGQEPSQDFWKFLNK